MSLSAQQLETYGQVMLPIFAPPAVLERGQGALVWDVDSKPYLDLLAGVSTNALGHADPRWVAAVSQQAAKLAHISNLFASPGQMELATTLLKAFNAPSCARVFFASTGTEANEAALKMALKGGRSKVLALEGSFHGRTMGALSLTANPAYRRGYEAFNGPVEFLPFGDVEALKGALAGDDVAALFVEIIQGEAGVIPLPAGYLQQARALTRAHGAFLVIDEVQTGVGRTGTWLAHQNPALVGAEPVEPDVVTLGKGLGGGFPISACLAWSAEAASRLSPGDHGTTLGGNPLACAAALATIGIIEQDGLLDHVNDISQAWRDELAVVPGVAQVRGQGLLLGLVLDQPMAPRVVAAALKAGYLVNAPATNVVRLAPPLVITRAQTAQFTQALQGLLNEASQNDA
ncbi:MAG: acetylornithine transaminase [Micrococcales bacterium]|nr:acetylornithine transaminase [Micrococcales bacterium]